MTTCSPTAAVGAPTTLQNPVNTDNYVRSFNAESIGASYTWFPGLSSNVDGVLFQQNWTTTVTSTTCIRPERWLCASAVAKDDLLIIV